MKALAWQDAAGKVWIGFNSAEYMKKRHDLTCRAEIECTGATVVAAVDRTPPGFKLRGFPMSRSDSASQGEGAGTARVGPLPDDELAGVQDVVDLARKFSGYVPTSFRIMARKPALLRAFSGLGTVVMREPGEVPAELKWLVAHSVSASAGCRYCQAHTAATRRKPASPWRRSKH